MSRDLSVLNQSNNRNLRAEVLRKKGESAKFKKEKSFVVVVKIINNSLKL